MPEPVSRTATPWAATLAAFAAYRLTRLVVADSILDEPRRRLRDWTYERPGFGPGRLHPRQVVLMIGTDRYDGPLTAARVKLTEMLSCGFCFGVWASLVATAAVLRRTPFRWDVDDWTAFTAIAGAQAILWGADGAMSRDEP